MRTDCRICFAITAMLLLVAVPSPGTDTNTTPTARRKPWAVHGTVRSVSGQPLSGAEIVAHCGIGTLFPTGKALSDSNGVYQLQFGPGILSPDRSMVQAATISVHLVGYFETNLYRQGNLLASLEPPTTPLHWGDRTTNDVVLPGIDRELHFVLAPAAQLLGRVLDRNRSPLANARIGIKGQNLPPSSSVLAEIRTDPKGEFRFENVPTGYEFQLYVDDGRSDWRKWPFRTFVLKEAKPCNGTLTVEGSSLIGEIATPNLPP